jgi:hypothetical protein
VPNRPLVFVCGLTFGDYLLWNWSLNSNHDVLALVSGLTLPPLAVVCVWLLALSLARLVARSARRPHGLIGRRDSRPQTGRSRQPTTTGAPLEDPAALAAAAAPATATAPAPPGDRSSGKLAA